MATIEELNKNYSKEKSFLEKLNAPGGLKDKIDQWYNDLAQLNHDYSTAKADYELAEAKNDKAAATTYKTYMEKVGNDIFKLRSKCEKAENFLLQQKQKVDTKFEDLKKDPEIKAKLDSILYKRYKRKQKQEINKKQTLQQIKEIVDAHPTVQSWLRGIEGYEKSINKIVKRMDEIKYNSVVSPELIKEFNDLGVQLPVLKQKLADRRKDLTDYFAKNHPEIDKDILEGLHSYDNIDRQIKGCDKSISNYNKAMANLSVEKVATPQSQRTPGALTSTVSENKPSWLHPIKRLKYSINQRKAKQTSQQPKTKKSTLRNDVRLSKDEYNAEIVQRYLNEQYKQGLHEAARPQETTEHDR